jgi:hypothetical protein
MGFLIINYLKDFSFVYNHHLDTSIVANLFNAYLIISGGIKLTLKPTYVISM